MARGGSSEPSFVHWLLSLVGSRADRKWTDPGGAKKVGYGDADVLRTDSVSASTHKTIREQPVRVPFSIRFKRSPHLEPRYRAELCK